MSAEQANIDDSLDLGRLSTKSCDLLAETLRERILSGSLTPGAKLPTERELAKQTGLSRGSVREAIRLLSAEGLVQARLGRYGGTVVSQPDHKMMVDFVSRFARGRNLPYSILHEAREAVEPSVARLAAERRSEAELQTLEALHADLAASVQDRDRFVRLNVAWHAAISQACGNDLLSSFLISLTSGFVAATDIDEYDTLAVREVVVQVHGRILDAIVARDGEAAARRMYRHVKASRAISPPDTPGAE